MLNKDLRWLNDDINNLKIIDEKIFFHRIIAIGKFRDSYFRSQIKGLYNISKFVNYINFRDLYDKFGHKKFQEKIISIAKKYHANIILIDLPYGGFHFDVKTFKIINSLDIKLFGMSFDNSTDFKFYLENYTFFDGVICTAPLTRYEFDSVGIPSTYFSPNIALNNLDNNKIDKDIEVSFVGNLKSDRKKWIDNLEKNGIKVHTVGYGTENGKVTLEEYFNILRRSKITLNFNTQNHHNIISVLDNNHKWKTCPTLRNVEASVAGTLCITEWVPEIELMFKKDTIEYFSNLDELVNKINYYLNNDEELLKKVSKIKSFTDAKLNDLESISNCVKYLNSKEAENFSKRGKVLRKNFGYSKVYKLVRINFFFRKLVKNILLRNFRESISCIYRIIKDILNLNFLIPFFLILLIFGRK